MSGVCGATHYGYGVCQCGGEGAVNLNDHVKVKLTERGRRVWLSYWRQIGGSDKWARDKVADNSLTEQLWQVMAIFGEHMCNGGDQLFERNEVEHIGDPWLKRIEPVLDRERLVNHGED